jgi:hypothetical protein
VCAHPQPKSRGQAQEATNNKKKNKAERLTLTDWYELCEQFSAAKEKVPSLSRNAFLRSEARGPKFQDTQTKASRNTTAET